MRLIDARAAFFADAGLGPAGGYNDRWVRIEGKPFPLYFLNTRSRVRSVKLHDLHHIATGYGGDWPGEVEIAAWELASGCGTHWWAWILNVAALTVGLFVAPRRAWRAFKRGRSERNLYREPVDLDALLRLSVGELRSRLGISLPF
jgi:hypothetical protein